MNAQKEEAVSSEEGEKARQRVKFIINVYSNQVKKVASAQTSDDICNTIPDLTMHEPERFEIFDHPEPHKEGYYSKKYFIFYFYCSYFAAELT